MTRFAEPKKKSEMDAEFIDWQDIMYWAIMGKRISMALQDKGMKFKGDEEDIKEIQRDHAFKGWQ